MTDITPESIFQLASGFLSRDSRPLSADFCVFFRSVAPDAVNLSQRVLSWFLCPGTDTLRLPQTRIEALSPW